MSISFERSTCNLTCWGNTSSGTTWEQHKPAQTQSRPPALRKISIKQIMGSTEQKSPPPQLKCLNNYRSDLSGCQPGSKSAQHKETLEQMGEFRKGTKRSLARKRKGSEHQSTTIYDSMSSERINQNNQFLFESRQPLRHTWNTVLLSEQSRNSQTSKVCPASSSRSGKPSLNTNHSIISNLPRESMISIEESCESSSMAQSVILEGDVIQNIHNIRMSMRKRKA